MGWGGEGKAVGSDDAEEAEQAGSVMDCGGSGKQADGEEPGQPVDHVQVVFKVPTIGNHKAAATVSEC